MKKFTVIIIMLSVIGSAFAQKQDRTTAFNHLRKGQLDKALQYIEPTISDPTTMNDAKTWFYRGNIYLQIHMDSAYKHLDPNALSKSFESYQRMMQLDTKKEFYYDAIKNLLVISEQLYNKGVESFKIADYNTALENFEKAVTVSASYDNIDTLAIFNAGLAAENAKLYPKAIELYNRIIELNYPQPLIYSSLSGVYLAQGDTLQAFEAIRKGREKYPEEFALLISETNLFLSTNQTEKAITNLQQAVKTDPMNPTIHYAVGASYDQMGNKSEAEKAYRKAVELKPDYFEPNYNLGALYVNQAAEIQNEANKLKLGDPKYDEMKAEADGILKKSLPYLETAATLDSTDKNTLIALKEIYTRLNMYDKLKEVNTKLNDM